MRGLLASLVTGLLLAPLGGCGKEGPPLPPLRLVPAPVAEISARRTGDDVELRFLLPTANQNGRGPVDLGRVEIYAVTSEPGAPPPPNQDLLVKERLIGTIDVAPPPADGPEPPAPTTETRPAPGDRVTFVEMLTPEKMRPVLGARGSGLEARESEPGKGEPVGDQPDSRRTKTGSRMPDSAPQTPTPETRAETPEATAPDEDPGVAHPRRIYAIRSVTRGGRPGSVSERVAVPLAAPPPPPGALAVQFTERAIVLGWVPPVTEPGEGAVAFNVYRDDGEGPALNESPLDTPEFQHDRVVFGEEQCFTVRSVATIGQVAIESEPSSRACTMPRDIFPPAAPAGLQIVAAADGISLSWDASAEPDLAGYVVLRGEAPDGTLQPLTPRPIRETSYRDTRVEPGRRYVYALVAVDTATPPNTSELSAREEVTAR